MLNVLWVEDEFTDQKQRSWFGNRDVSVITNFIEAKDAINNRLEQFD
jgi:hypothetical protein